MPCLLFYKTSTAEVSLGLMGKFAIAVLGGFAIVLVFSLFVTRLAAIPGPQASSVVQGSIRHNSFVALSVAERLFGVPGLSLGALVVSILIPATNFCSVTMMATLNKSDDDTKLLSAILRDLARNPLIISVVGGLVFNLLNVGQIPVFSRQFENTWQCRAANRAAMRRGKPEVRFDPVLRAHRFSCRSSVSFLVFPAATLGLSLLVGFSEMESVYCLAVQCWFDRDGILFIGPADGGRCAANGIYHHHPGPCWRLYRFRHGCFWRNI